jgi:predicted esterase
MPYIKFILPTAPTQPVTMNMGMPMPSWYDIKGLDERANEDCKGISESKARIEGILAKEHSERGLPYSRMLLAGFSQGGALSLFTGLQLDQPLAGIVVLSGYLPAAGKFNLKQSKDPMVQLTMAQKTKQRLTEAGIEDYTLKTYSIPHSVSPEELLGMMQFIAKVLPPDDSCRIKLKDPREMSVKELKAAIKSAGLGSKAVGLMEKSEFIKLVEDHRAGKL